MILALFSALVAACTGTPPELISLRQDPAASLRLSTADEVDRNEHDGSETLGKPGRLIIEVTYTPKAGETGESVFQELVPVLEDSGWEITTHSPTSYSGQKSGELTPRILRVYQATGEQDIRLEIEAP